MWKRLKSYLFPSPPRVWLGNVQAAFHYDDTNRVSTWAWHLYIDTKGKRFVELSGDVRGDWEPVRHQRYSLVIVPFMGGCSFNYLYEHLDIVNDEFWNMFDEKKKKAPHNFTLLSFPKKDET